MGQSDRIRVSTSPAQGLFSHEQASTEIVYLSLADAQPRKLLQVQ